MPRSLIRPFCWVIQATRSSLELAIFEERPGKGSEYYHFFLSSFIQYIYFKNPVSENPRPTASPFRALAQPSVNAGYNPI